MGEISDLFGVYGAIDRAVVEDGGRREAVSRLLTVYSDPDVRWFDEFVAWTRELRPDTPEDEAFPPLEKALGELAEIEPSPRMRARRLFAIAVAARAYPAMLDADSELNSLARGALSAGELAANDDDAQSLLDLLGDDGLLPAVDDQDPSALDGWWKELLKRAADDELIADPEAMGPRPCTGRLVEVDTPGGPDQVATLTVVFETTDLKFDRATRFLDPGRWPGCNGFWCAMDDRGVQPSGVHRYHEVVSLDCKRRARVWTLDTELDFKFTRDQDVAITEYQLSDGPPQPMVLVDEGSLVVHQLGSDAAPRLKITTTKRIRFDHPFSGKALALIMCAMGYASIAEDLVYTCAGSKARGVPFPAQEGATKLKPGAPSLGPAIKTLGDQAAAAVKACADDWSDAVDASRDKADRGAYTADALVQDMADMWARMLREGATGVDLAVRSGQTVARPRPRPGPGD